MAFGLGCNLPSPRSDLSSILFFPLLPFYSMRLKQEGNGAALLYVRRQDRSLHRNLRNSQIMSTRGSDLLIEPSLTGPTRRGKETIKSMPKARPGSKGRARVALLISFRRLSLVHRLCFRNREKRIYILAFPEPSELGHVPSHEPCPAGKSRSLGQGPSLLCLGIERV